MLGKVTSFAAIAFLFVCLVYPDPFVFDIWGEAPTPRVKSVCSAVSLSHISAGECIAPQDQTGWRARRRPDLLMMSSR